MTNNGFGPFPPTPVEFQDEGLRNATTELKTGPWWELLTLREGLAHEYGIRSLGNITSQGLVDRVKKAKQSAAACDYPSMKIGQTANTSIHRTDKQGAGGAHHEYEIRDEAGLVLGCVSFQNGPIGENGVNGVQHADLLLIVQDRLDCFQRGPYASTVNEVTCGHVSAAIAVDATRTRRRELDGVEGTSAKAAGVES